MQNNNFFFFDFCVFLFDYHFYFQFIFLACIVIITLIILSFVLSLGFIHVLAGRTAAFDTFRYMGTNAHKQSQPSQ